MGTAKNHLQVKYFAAIAYIPELQLQKAISAIETIFSPIEHDSPVYEYTGFTHYYNQEMGDRILKKFIVFKDLLTPEALPELKLATNALEEKYTHSGIRQLNIDPGYVSEAKVVLATTKNYSHRIYLNKGIYGDLHLMYAHKRFQTMPWTYPDYQTPERLQFFEGVREQYLKQLKDTL